MTATSVLGTRDVRTSRAVLSAAVLGTALAYMSDDMLNLAIPSVARDLGATVTDAQWILDSYYVALVSTALIAGSFGDVVGHRRIFVAGNVGFVAGAVWCALAPSVPVLVAGRFVQGVAGAMLLTAGLALVARSSPVARRGRAVGRFLGLVAAVPALGPFLSGSIVDRLSWRWLFVAPLGLPIASLVITSRSVPETARLSRPGLDLAGAMLAFMSLAGLSVALISGGTKPTDPLPVASMAVSIAAAAGFVHHERRAPDPLLPLDLLRRPVFVGANAVWFLACMTSWGAVFFVAVMLQTTLGATPMMAGILLTPVYLVMLIGSPRAGRLSDRIGPRRPVLAGLTIYAFGLLLLGIAGTSGVPAAILGILVMAAGMAGFTAPLAAAMMAGLDDSAQGLASAFNNLTGQLAGLFAILVLPAAAGLAGIPFDHPGFAAGFGRALLVAAVITAGSILVAAATLRNRHAPAPAYGGLLVATASGLTSTDAAGPVPATDGRAASEGGSP